MAKEKLESKWSLPLRRTFRNTMLATALWATLLTWTTGCNSNNEWNDKNQEKIELTDNANTGTDWNTVQLEEAVNQWRKVINTETYENKEGCTITKKTYDDGSWSEECEYGRSDYEFKEYYPNSNTMKFEKHQCGDAYGNTIWDENWNVLYSDWRGGSEALDWWDEYNKYDKNDRITYDFNHWETYTYDDENKTVTVTIIKNNCKRIRVYKQDDTGNTNWGKIISDTFIWQTGKEVNLTGWWVEQLYKERNIHY